MEFDKEDKATVSASQDMNVTEWSLKSVQDSEENLEVTSLLLAWLAVDF